MLAQLDEHLVESKGIHFDTLTAAKLIEHRGERPYDAASDARLRNEIADYYRKRGKVICSESMRDWANLRQDLATSKTFAPFSESTTTRRRARTGSTTPTTTAAASTRSSTGGSTRSPWS